MENEITPSINIQTATHVFEINKPNNSKFELFIEDKSLFGKHITMQISLEQCNALANFLNINL